MKVWHIAVILLALFAMSAVFCADSDDSDAATGTDIRVWIQASDGQYKETTVSASSVEDTINSAANNLDIEIEYTDLGTIKSVDGVTAYSPYTWVVHQWMPLGTHDWAEVGFDEVSDSKLISGTSYCLHLCNYELVEGKRVYDVPNFKPVSDGYVFIRFVYKYDDVSDEIQSAFTTEIRKEGFWLKGTGSSLADVLKSAMEENGFELKLVTTIDSNGNDLQGWIDTMFGIGDVNLGGAMDWAYWSQYVYIDNQWSYNDYTMGYYDPGVYKYLACIYIQSYNGELDFGGTMPDPDDGFKVMKHYQTVTFKVAGETVGTANVEYGRSLTSSQIPTGFEVPEGYTFVGWGNVTAAITEDTVFEAVLSAGTGNHTVTYVWGGNSVIETVADGATPTKYREIEVPSYESGDKVYTFAGWTLDPNVDQPTAVDLTSPVTANMTVYAFYTSADLPRCTVRFVLDGSLYQSVSVVKGRSLTSAQIPTVSEKGVGFTGWSNPSLSISDAITEDTDFEGSRIFTVEYLNGTQSVQSESVAYGKYATYAGVPVKAASEYYTYSFLGWSATGSSDDLFAMSTTAITKNTVLYAVFKETAITCTVTLVLDGGTYRTLTVNKGTVLSESDLSVTVPEGKYFTGWANGSRSVSDPVTEDITFTGSLLEIQKEVVEYYVSGVLVKTEEVENGGYATYSGIPSKAETATTVYVFIGWSETDGGTEIFDRSTTPITGKTVLYAVFSENEKPKCKVTFLLDGENYKVVELVVGGTLSESDLSVTVPEGKYFTGWANGSRSVSDPVTEDITFTGSLRTVVLTVRYYSSDVLLHTEEVEYGQSATYSDVPSKSSSDHFTYSFVGWSETGSAENLFAASAPILKDTDLYAVFKESPIECTVTFVVNGVTVSEVRVDKGKSLVSSQIPAPQTGYGTIDWGGANIYAPIEKDTVFTGTSEPSVYRVRFYSESGILLMSETVGYGKAAEYSGLPEKEKTQQYSFSFLGWSVSGTSVVEDKGEAVLTDLSSVVGDMDLYPVFLGSLNTYAVGFYDYDRSLIKTIEVAYGTAVTDYPEEPYREQSVDKVFTFKGWSISPVGWKAADLDKVVQTQYVYAYYTYTLRQYEVSLFDGDGMVGSYSIGYGMYLSESVFIYSLDGYMARLYSDKDLTKAVDTTYTVLGDTVLYVEKLPGTYGYYSGGSKTETDRITVSFTQEQAAELASYGTVVADISMFAAGKSVMIDSASIRNLEASFGQTDISVVLGRGTMTMDLGLLAEGLSSGYAEFSVDKGPTTGKLSNTLKKVNYDMLYSISVETDGSVFRGGFSVSVPYTPDSNELNSPKVWSADYGTGVLTEIPCAYSDGHLTFDVGEGVLYAVGTAYARSGTEESSDPCPYGTVDYRCEGEDKDTYASTLVRMDLDNGGRTLFVPSALEGYPLKHILDTAFLGLRDVPTVVIPSTVLTFDWSSFAYISVSKVVFVGDAPEFSGTVPSGLTVCRLSGTSGWDGYSYEEIVVPTYTLSNGASFTYYLLDGEIIVHGYVSGTEFKIPEEVSIGGTNYPVTVIGANSFQDADVTSVKFPSSVREIQTRAFYGSSLRNITWSSGIVLEYICDEAFRACTKLRTSEIPEGVRFIGFEAYRDCAYLVTVVIPDSVKELGGGAYYDCVIMENLTIGSGVTVIPERAFAYCNLLDNVYLPDNVTELAENAFYKCYMLTEIDTNKVVSIGYSAFALCGSLRSVTLGSGLVSIGSGAFAKDPLLTTVLAYCVQPEGFESAWDGNGVPEGVTVIANYDVANGWSVSHQVQEKEDDLSESFESRTLPYVIGALIVFFAVLIIYCYKTKGRSYRISDDTD